MNGSRRYEQTTGYEKLHIRPRNQPVLKLNIFAYSRRLGPVIAEYTVVIESDTVLQVHSVSDSFPISKLFDILLSPIHFLT